MTDDPFLLQLLVDAAAARKVGPPDDDWEGRLYGDPERCGFTLVGELENENSCWDFNTVIALRQTGTGKVFAGYDSGCSCPVPFEGFETVADLTEIVRPGDMRQFVEANQDGYVNWPVAERLALYRTVDALVAR